MQLMTPRNALQSIGKLCAVGLAVVALVGCSGTGDTRDGALDPGIIQGPSVTPVTIGGVLDGEAFDPGSISGRAPVERVIYFDYDQSELRSEYLDIIAQHGRYLAQTPAGRVRLEGHTDERGTREYNIALGERRAKSVARMLQLQGVSSAQVRTVSYGEELPVDEAHNSSAWAKNRRVNIIYEDAVQN